MDLAIKFGSNEIIVYRKGFGIVARKSSYVATNKGGSKVCEYGDEAKYLCGLKPSQYDLHEPIKGVEIANTKLAVSLLANIINEAVVDNSKINAIVAVPCALTEKNLLELKMLLHEAGVSKVQFVQNGVCVRCNMPLSENSKIMIVDMGKYLLDISVLSRYEFIFGRDYFIGGAEMDVALKTYIEDNYGVVISEEQTETVKEELVSMYMQDTYTTTFTGIDSSGEYKQVTMRANEARVAIIGVYNKIFDMIDQVIKSLPDKLSAEIKKNGIVFTGGVSSIEGLVEYASKRLNIPVNVIDNPKDAVILGAGKLLSLDKEDYPYIKL